MVDGSGPNRSSSKRNHEESNSAKSRSNEDDGQLEAIYDQVEKSNSYPYSFAEDEVDITTSIEDMSSEEVEDSFESSDSYFESSSDQSEDNIISSSEDDETFDLKFDEGEGEGALA